MSKAFSQCSLFDLAHAIFEHARAARARALDSAAADRLLPALRNAALTKAVLSRHPLVQDHSGLKCDGSAYSKRAWCGMLRDLVAAAGVDVSDAALLRVYLVCKECAKRGRVQLPPPDVRISRSLPGQSRARSRRAAPPNRRPSNAREGRVALCAQPYSTRHRAPSAPDGVTICRMHSGCAVCSPSSTLHVRLYGQGVRPSV